MLLPPLFLSGLFLLSGAAAPTDNTDYLRQALAAPVDGPVYTYVLHYEDKKIKAHGTVDPSKPRGERVTMASPPEEKWSKSLRKGIRRMDKNAEKNLWCAQTAKYIPNDAKLVKQTADTATYSFAPMADPDDQEEQKLMRGVVGSVTVAKQNPAILEVSLIAPKPFKPMSIAKIKKFNTTVKCERAPDGRTYASDWTVHVKGSVLVKKVEQKTIRRISALKPVTN